MKLIPHEILSQTANFNQFIDNTEMHSISFYQHKSGENSKADFTRLHLYLQIRKVVDT